VQYIGQNTTRHLDAVGVDDTRKGDTAIATESLPTNPPPPPPSREAEGLNLIASISMAASDLEIGVATGKSFLNVNISSKHSEVGEEVVNVAPSSRAATLGRATEPEALASSTG
jgi:hypothetical protein